MEGSVGCRILFDRDENRAVLYDSVTDWAFGPVFAAHECGDRHLDAREVAERFCAWIVERNAPPEHLVIYYAGRADPRIYRAGQLGQLYAQFLDELAGPESGGQSP